MQAINHTLTATIIAVTLKEPLLVAPLALVSHFALDMLPHYGNYAPLASNTQAFLGELATDGMLSILAYGIAIQVWPQLQWVISLSVFLALLPDLLWPLALHVKHRGPLWAFFRFHTRIQRESPGGILFEGFWLVAAVGVLVAI